MINKHLDARGKGEIDYDYANDVLLFKVKDRDYLKSVDFDNIVIDVDTKGFITGMRIFDASKMFNLSKLSLKNIRGFEFNAKAEDKVISIQLRFVAELRNKKSVIQGQNIERASDAFINNSEVCCTVA